MARPLFDGAFAKARANISGRIELKDGKHQRVTPVWFWPVVRTALVGTYIGIGIAVYTALEPWSANEAAYFSVVTMSTVGYGDLSPSTTGSQVFTLFFIFIGIGAVFTQIIALVGGLFGVRIRWSRSVLDRAFPEELVDIDGDGSADFRLPRPPLVHYSKKLSGPLLLALALQLFFAGIFTAIEGWDLWTSFYHCMVTATTVGYGDVAILTDGGRAWAIVQVLVSVCVIGALVNDVGELMEERRLALKKVALLRKKLDTDLIKSLDKDGSGVDRLEFVLGMLTKLGLVDWEEVEPFLKQFDELDTDKSGKLDAADLAALAERYQTKLGAVGKAAATENELGMGVAGQVMGTLTSTNEMVMHALAPRLSGRDSGREEASPTSTSDVELAQAGGAGAAAAGRFEIRAAPPVKKASGDAATTHGRVATLALGRPAAGFNGDMRRFR